ncbi:MULTISPECIES: sensor histidine kinase [unclassified Streptomyces]|uniref:sensor histidine kinase n=1 Tax=unclassified Streptomyces TaxID=2593676 RepID=UPI004042E477
MSGEPRPLPPGIDVTAYRIIQEAPTNTLKYGDGGTATVTVRYADHGLRVKVLNSGPSVLSADAVSTGRHARKDDGAGRRLIGLRERVAVYGGHFNARHRIGGGYRVRARLPLLLEHGTGAAHRTPRTVIGDAGVVRLIELTRGRCGGVPSAQPELLQVVVQSVAIVFCAAASVILPEQTAVCS